MLRYLRAVVCPPAPRTACGLVVGAAKFAEKGDEWVFRESFHRLASVGWSVRMDQPSGDLSSAAHESDELKPGFELSVSCTSERATIGLLRLTLREARDLGTRVTGFAPRAGQDCGSQAPLL